MTSQTFESEYLAGGELAAAALERAVERCRDFARAIPPQEKAQAAALEEIIEATGEDVRSGALQAVPLPAGDLKVLRLHKERLGEGRLKLQLFPLGEGEAHPPHAHYNLLSCQILLRGRARVREYSLLRRLAGDELEIREEAVKCLEPGDGVFTLQRRNNIHWQEGLAGGSVLLNINWQGFFAETPLSGERSLHGRCHIDWPRARPGPREGTFIVPQFAET